MARVGEASMTATILVRRPLAENANNHPTEWDYVIGGYPESASGEYKSIWVGQARVQPDVDWHSRPFELGSETTAILAVRFQLPLADGEWADGLDPVDKDFLVEDEIIITASAFPQLASFLKYVYVVRNPDTSSTFSLRRLLADVNLKGRRSDGD